MSFSIYSVQAEILDFSYMDLTYTEYKRNDLQVILQVAPC
jgi:hypothetical protein